MINISQYYVGSNPIDQNSVPVKSYKAGMEIKPEPVVPSNNEILLPKFDTLVKYDFSTKDEDGNLASAKIDTKEEFIALSDGISAQYGPNVIVNISGIDLSGFLPRNEDGKMIMSEEYLLNQEKMLLERNKGIEKIIHVGNTIEEILQTLQSSAKSELYMGHDDENILNHSLVNSAFSFGAEFQKAAIGYAKYLNRNIESEYDDAVFYGFENEETYREEVKDMMSQYAGNILSYFSMNQFSIKDKESLTEQLVDSLMEYAKQAANGNRDLNNLKSKLTINGVDMTYGEFDELRKTLQELNTAGTGSDKWSERLTISYLILT